MDISQYDIIITKHAMLRAQERGIDEDRLERIILTSERTEFGKHYSKWVKRYKYTEITLVGCIENNVVKILTVEVK
jgi:hypothetical protein